MTKNSHRCTTIRPKPDFVLFGKENTTSYTVINKHWGESSRGCAGVEIKIREGRGDRPATLTMTAIASMGYVDNGQAIKIPLTPAVKRHLRLLLAPALRPGV